MPNIQLVSWTGPSLTSSRQGERALRAKSRGKASLPLLYNFDAHCVSGWRVGGNEVDSYVASRQSSVMARENTESACVERGETVALLRRLGRSLRRRIEGSGQSIRHHNSVSARRTSLLALLPLMMGFRVVPGSALLTAESSSERRWKMIRPRRALAPHKSGPLSPAKLHA